MGRVAYEAMAAPLPAATDHPFSDVMNAARQGRVLPDPDDSGIGQHHHHRTCTYVAGESTRLFDDVPKTGGNGWARRMASVLTVTARLSAAEAKGEAMAALLVEEMPIVRDTEPGTVA